MLVLIAGLVLFLGLHSIRIVADGWRSAQLARRGEMAWKLGYTVLSLLGFGLIVWGFMLARQSPVVLWPRVPGMNHLAGLLTLMAFVLLAAAYVPANHLKARLRHPMLLATKTWALAHLLANNTLADEVLFASFLAWAALCFRAARLRDRAGAPAPAAGTTLGTVLSVLIGIGAWAAFAFWGHAVVIGVKPF